MASFTHNMAEDELERKIQEEYRRRQAAHAFSSALATARARAGQAETAAYGGQHHLSSLKGIDAAAAAAMAAASPYYARSSGTTAAPPPPPPPHHAAPYTRVTNPYAGLAEAHAAYQQAAARSPTTDNVAAQLYAAGIRPSLAAAYAGTPIGGYGTAGAGGASPSGYRASPDQQQQQCSASAAAHYASSYGALSAVQQAPQPSPPGRYGRDAYGAPVPSAGPSPGSGASQSYGAKNTPTLTKYSQQKASPSSLIPGSAVKPHITVVPPPPRAMVMGGKGMAQRRKEIKKELPKRMATKDGKIILNANGNGPKVTYYTGCLPLGLDDDKYWLSELQVYLRSNFAEAFGATEEDIAAPMHGRNKPIALGQVGIRCKHCKSMWLCNNEASFFFFCMLIVSPYMFISFQMTTLLNEASKPPRIHP